MLRDSRCDRAYFEKSIQQYREKVDFYAASLKEDGISDRKKRALSDWCFSGKLKIVISRYSIGDDISDVEEEFFGLLDKLDLLVTYHELHNDKKLPLDDYNNLLWLISLAILLDLDVAYFEKIADAVDKISKHDRLIDLLLLNKLKNRNISGDSFYAGDSEKIAERYRPLFVALESNNGLDKASILKDYLKAWYKRQQLCVWYGSHNKDNYFGYWAFEAAAIAKIIGLKDASFEQNAYFPGGFNRNA